MDRFIGVDTHLQACLFGVMSPSGKRQLLQPVETNGEALTNFLRSISGRKHLCMEEGTHSEWLYEVFEPLVHEIAVVQPKKRKRKGSKSDCLDAWELADKMRAGNLEGLVFKAPSRFTALRQAVRAHRMLQRDEVRVKLRLNALYRSRGVTGLGDAIYDPTQRQDCLSRLPKHQRSLAELLAEELDGIIPAYQQAEQWLREEAKRTALVRRIATAPGLGLIRAAQVVATVVTPHRFRTKRQFWSYCGLGIVTRASSEYVKNRSGQWVRQKMPLPRGLNRNRNPLLKNVFKGAAITVINKKSDPLHQSYQRLVEGGTKPNLARLTLARRIAGAVLAMWKNQEDYDPAKHQQTAPV